MFLAIVLSKNNWLKYLVKSRLFSACGEKPGWIESLCIGLYILLCDRPADYEVSIPTIQIIPWYF